MEIQNFLNVPNCKRNQLFKVWNSFGWAGRLYVYTTYLYCRKAAFLVDIV